MVYLQLWAGNCWVTPLSPQLNRITAPDTPELRERVLNARRRARLVCCDSGEVVS